MKRVAMHVSLLLNLAACTVGPGYEPPRPAVATEWGSTPSPTVTSASPATVAWWSTFHDPMLEELIREAIAANLDLRIAKIRVREARALLGVSQSAKLPQANANGALSAVSVSVDTPAAILGDRQRNVYQMGFDAAWEIDIFGNVRSGIDAATAELEARDAGELQVVVSLLAEVARTYVDLRQAHERAHIVEQTIAVQQDLVGLVGSLQAAGRATPAEVARAARQLSFTEASLPDFQFAMMRASHRLCVLLGRVPGNDFLGRLGPPGQISAPPRIPIGLPGDMLRRRADVRAAERELAAATARIRVATAALYPRFSLTGATGLTSISADNLFDDRRGFWSLGPTFSWPILEFGRLRSAVAAADERAKAAAVAYERTILVAFEETRIGLEGFGKEQQRLDRLQAAVTKARIALESARSRNQAGLERFQTVLDSQQELLATEDAAAVSRAVLAIRLIQTYKALGGGWEAFYQHGSPLDGSADHAD